MSVKKMVIVPYQVLETMKWWKDKQYQKPILPPYPQAVDASHLLKDMNQILQKTDLSEAEKTQKYGETLFKLQNSLEKTKKNTFNVILDQFSSNDKHGSNTNSIYYLA